MKLPSRSTITLYSMMAVIAPMIWMGMDRKPAWEFTRVEMEPSQVYPGDEALLTFTARKLRNCGPGMVYREFKDSSGRLLVYDPIQRSQEPEPDEHGRFTRVTKISSSMEPGPAIYNGRSCYSCNPIHYWLRWPVCSNTPTLHFEVLKRTGAN